MALATIKAQHIEKTHPNAVIDGFIAVDKDDYGGNFANYSPDTPETELEVRLAIDTNSNKPGKRLYIYKDETWYYTPISEAGRETFTNSGTAAADVSVNVTFANPFSYKPRVVLGPEANLTFYISAWSQDTAGNYTGFTLTAVNVPAGSTVYCSWVAE